MEMTGATIVSQASLLEKNREHKKVTTKSKRKYLPKRSKPVHKPKCLEKSALEADNFEVSDGENDVISKGGESSIGDNRVTSLTKAVNS